jgi:hypothetical protein
VLNNLETIFPVEIKKTKLNDEIKDAIFKEFHFKFVSKSSTSQKIIQEIYNTFFQKFVVTTTKDLNENYNYLIKNKKN